jgi:REP element-mobilizing transposase RayT
MPRTRYRIFETEFPYFVTSTVVAWLPVFTRPEAVQVVLDSWRFLQQTRDFRLYGYVILENHLHFVASAPELANDIKSFKMYTARHVIDLLERYGAKTLLEHLRAFKLRHKGRSEHQLWQEGGKPKQVRSAEMMLQKLEYAHNNPVKRGYVEQATHWRYSSARDYAGQKGLIDIVKDWA